MVDFIEELYEHVKLVAEIKKVIELTRQKDFKSLERMYDPFTEHIAALCKSIAMIDNAAGSKLWLEFKNAFDSASDGNKGLLADNLERLLPYMYQCLKLFGTIDVTDGRYRILSSDSGFLIAQDITTGKYYNSSIDPMWEAVKCAEKLYDPGYEHFKIIGCEMGYLAYALYTLYDGDIDIYIYNPDKDQVRLALDYGVLSWIDENRLHIYTDLKEEELLDGFSTVESSGEYSTGYYVYDEMLGEFSENYRKVLDKFVFNNKTELFFKEISRRNFVINKRYLEKTIYDIDARQLKKDWIIVAAGPSLDDQIDFIKNNSDRCTIIAASTVYKKLLTYDIVPDYIAAIDPQNRTYGHLEGVENTDTPLIMTITSNWKFGAKYKGDKYIYPASSVSYVEEYFADRKIETLKLGGSVTILAIRAAIELGADIIQLVGADMGFPGGMSHVKGTMDYSAIDKDECISVESVDGETVYADKLMCEYREEIEELIVEYPSVRFVNYSNKGALIKGATWYKDVN